MKIEILIGDISNLVTRTKASPELITTIQFDAKIPPANIARLINLQRQGAPILVAVSSPQAVMDLDLLEYSESKQTPAPGSENHGTSKSSK
jgi:hypothetical protein